MNSLIACSKCGGEAEYFQSGPVPYNEEMIDNVGVKCTKCSNEISSPDWVGAEVEFRKHCASEDWNA